MLIMLRRDNIHVGVMSHPARAYCIGLLYIYKYIGVYIPDKWRKYYLTLNGGELNEKGEYLAS